MGVDGYHRRDEGCAGLCAEDPDIASFTSQYRTHCTRSLLAGLDQPHIPKWVLFLQTASDRPIQQVVSNKLLLLIFVAVALLALLAVAGTNYLLNPMIYSSSHLRTIASRLNAGGNYAIYDPNINWRALRREHIRIMTTTPDVLLGGGSDWQEASADLVQGKSFYNAHVHADFVEDIFALTYLLEDSGRMPDTLILSIGHLAFQPLDRRKFTEWLEWAPEYRAMADKLQIEPHFWFEMLRTKDWQALISLRELKREFVLHLRRAEMAGPTDLNETESLDVIVADGSLVWSKASQARFTPTNAHEASLEQLSQLPQIDENEPQVDPALVEATDKFIAHLKTSGVNVVLVLAPFNPEYYDVAHQLPFGKTLHEVDSIAKRFGEKYGIAVVGSFDPHEVGCTAEQFHDSHHPTHACLKQVFKQISLAGSHAD